MGYTLKKGAWPILAPCTGQLHMSFGPPDEGMGYIAEREAAKRIR